jgi:hypothetical protein
MNREIKFRAWDRERQHWATVMVADFLNPSISPQYQLQQFTGLADKNGVEIYEGDIIEYSASEYWAPKPFYGKKRSAVEWQDITCSFTPGLNSGLSEVIGNIYESPELLEATK